MSSMTTSPKTLTSTSGLSMAWTDIMTTTMSLRRGYMKTELEITDRISELYHLKRCIKNVFYNIDDGDVNVDIFTSLIENIIDELKWVLDEELN